MNPLKLFLGLLAFSTIASMVNGKQMKKRKHRKKGGLSAESGDMPTVTPALVFGTGLFMTGFFITRLWLMRRCYSVVAAFLQICLYVLAGEGALAQGLTSVNFHTITATTIVKQIVRELRGKGEWVIT